MDISLLEDYLNYKPIFDENPQFIVDEIKDKLSKYIPADKINEIQKAYEFALNAHKTTPPRHSQEPYISHPVCVAKWLCLINPDLASIQSAFLHDVIEDTDFTYQDIKSNFGQEVADLCQGLVKVSKFKYRGEERQIETLKKTFLAMGKDLRVIFIKLADRIHNIQTLGFHPKADKIQRIANETLKIYVPIAQRLGLSVFQGYLENGAFRYLNPDEFYRIFNYIKENYQDKDYINDGEKTLSDLLKKYNVGNFSIKGRIKSPYRIYTKLVKYQTKDISKIMDIVAFRIITDKIETCYNMLGFIHSKYTPIIRKIKDYIALPKPNGYKSLHTTVLGMFDKPVEIQIRTFDMDNYAEYGVAAHFAYKEAGKSVSIHKSQSIWIQKLQELVKEFQENENKEDFKNTLNIEFLEKNIFVYTPKGDIIELPQNSTVLDFAFRIHTDVGLRYKNAIVNGAIVPIDYKLKTGDIVQINTFKNKYTASSFWSAFLYTPSARAKLHRFLKQNEKENILNYAKELVNSRLRELDLPILGTKDDLVTKTYSEDELKDLFMKVYEKQISPNKIIKNVYKDIPKTEKTDKKSQTTKPIFDYIIVDIDKKLNYTLCPECKPQKPDKIIAKTGKDSIKIHKLTCKGLVNVGYDKLMEAHWDGQLPNIYKTVFVIEASNSSGALMKVLSIFYMLNINIENIKVDGYRDNKSIVSICCDFENPSKIFFVVKEIKQKDFLKLLDIKIM